MPSPSAWGLCALCFTSILLQAFLGPHGLQFGEAFSRHRPHCAGLSCVFGSRTRVPAVKHLCVWPGNGLAPEVVCGNCVRSIAGALGKCYKQLQESLYESLTEDKTLQLPFKLDFIPFWPFILPFVHIAMRE